MTDTPTPDRAPAADPAVDALNRVTEDLVHAHRGVRSEADLAITRDALADRIPPSDARIIIAVFDGTHMTAFHAALIARLGRIADRDKETGR